MNENGLPLSYENNPETTAAVHHLRDLIKLRFPDPKADVFTLDSFEYRYKLHGLNQMAIQDIERSQRINRALRDFFQSGLNEFHIGLIYLYWGQCHAAEKQFEMAWRQWSFVHEPGGSSVAQMGRGYAQQLVHQYEEAMISFGKASRELSKASQDVRFDFCEKMEKYLDEARGILIEKMHPLPDIDTEPPESETLGEFPTSDIQESEAVEVQAEPLEEGHLYEDDGTEVDVPPPRLSNLSDDPMPIDGHSKEDDSYRWYVVEERMSDNFMPQFHAGDWLLVHMEPEQSDVAPTPGEPVVIVSETESGSTIHLKPHASESNAHGRIYLRTVTAQEGAFYRDTETGEVQPQFERVVQEFDILGVVIGLWRPTAKVIN